LEINKTVIVASRWFLFYLTYMDDARSKHKSSLFNIANSPPSVYHLGKYQSYQ